MKLRQLIDQYVAFRKDLGAKIEANEALLGTFSRFVGESQNIRKVKPQQVAAFLDGRGVVTRHWHRKYVVLRVFFRYAVSRGYLPASLLPANVPKRPERFKPYVYSREELRRLLDCAQSAQTRRFQMDAATFRALLLLLYGAGLRVGEALSLNLEDVDLKQAVIIVRDTKFFKTRLVPLGTDLNEVLAKYAARRKETGQPSSGELPFFASTLGSRLGRRLVERNFQRLRTHAGVRREDGARYQPRLHDLRHTSAVHRLTAWYQEGQDVQRLLPLLSTYLGHTSIACTQIYLTLTPDLLHEGGKRFAEYAFGKVGHD